jgi:cell division septum initiation protein DivIVA
MPSLPRRAAGGTQQVDSELNQIALAIEDLQSRLEKANERLGNVEYMEATEFEIGRLLVEAQRTSESTLVHLEAKVYEVLMALEAKANQILAEATEEARQMREQTQEASLAATQIAHDLQAAVGRFISANAEFLGGPNNVLVSETRTDAPQAVGENRT